MTALRQLSCENWLKQCKLTTLETRRIRGDQIEAFKIMHNFEGIDKSNVFKVKEADITSGHNY